MESRTFSHRVPGRTRQQVVDELTSEAGGEPPSNFQVELASSGAAGPTGGGTLFSRHCGAALLDLGPEGGLLWVVGLHMLPGPASSPIAVETREQEAALLLPKLAELEAQAPTVVMGDFNSEVEEAVHRQLGDAGWANVMALPTELGGGGGVARTIDSAGLGDEAIDHIYLSRNSRMKLAGACVVRSAGFRSDSEADTVHSGKCSSLPSFFVGTLL